MGRVAGESDIHESDDCRRNSGDAFALLVCSFMAHDAGRSLQDLVPCIRRASESVIVLMRIIADVSLHLSGEVLK
jgi:hypothetical protein